MPTQNVLFTFHSVAAACTSRHVRHKRFSYYSRTTLRILNSIFSFCGHLVTLCAMASVTIAAEQMYTM